MFSTQSEICILICQYFDIKSLFAAELEEPKIGMWGEGLNCFGSITLAGILWLIARLCKQSYK